MLIDWTTVSFQVVNFLLLIVLLKRYLYGPILRAMQRREEELSAIRKEAEDKRTRADQELQSYRNQQQEWEEEAASRLKQVETEAEQRRRELLEQARDEADERRRTWRQALANERRDFLDQVKKRSAEGVLNVSRRALAELADTELETALVRVLIDKLHALPGDDLEGFVKAARKGALKVISGWEPEGNLHRQLADALSQACETSVELDWRQDPELQLGIEINGDGLRLAWGTEGYLERLQRSVAELFDRQGGPAKEES